MALIPPATWDDLDTTNWDRLWTWDDPMANARLDAAYLLGTTTHDGPKLTFDWGGGEVTEGLISPIERDLFDRVSASGWGISTSGEPWTTTHSGNTSVDGDNGLLSAAAVNTSYFQYMAGVSAIDFDITAKLSIDAITSGAKASFYLVGRGQDTSNGVRFRVDFNTDQIVGWGIESVAGGTATALSSQLVQDTIHAAGSKYWIRAQGFDSLLRIKVWPDGKPQPYNWNSQTTDSVWVGSPGWIGLMFMLQTGNTNALPVIATVYNFYVGLTNVFDAGSVSTGLSYDDGMPQAVTNASAIGVNEATAELAGPIGTDAGQYFSTFDTTQPWWDIDRDVAGVTISATTVAPDGVRDTRVFTGQMEDVPTDGRDANLQAISKTRLLMSGKVQPPAVHGFYEGCEGTWPVSFALFQSGVYVAPPPLPGCRFYAPFHGSTHSFIPSDNGYSGFGLGWLQGSDGVPQSYQRPPFVNGPFLAGLDNRIDGVGTNRLALRTAGFRLGAGQDLLSKACNQGRVELWVRADETDIASSEDPGISQLTFIYFANQAVSRWFQLGIGANDRKPFVFIADGTNTFFARGEALPADGEWHFIGAGWDIANNKVRLRVDEQTDSYTAGSLTTANLPATDDISAANISSYLPIAELRITAGPWAAPQWGTWANQVGFAVGFTPGAILRRSVLDFNGLAETEAREAFEYVSEIARGELATTGFNEVDQFVYLPLSYWVETQQQIVWEALSTDDNLGDDLRITRPVNKVYNRADVAFKESSVQETFAAVYTSSQLVQIGTKQTLILEITFTTPTIEMKSQSITVMSGTALAATPPSASNAINYITLNSEQDGTGTYATSFDFVATILSWIPGSAIIQLQNKGGRKYIANNVSLPPFSIAGKPFLVADAVVSQSVDSSITQRGARLLTADMPAIQTADNARSMALELVSRLHKPRMQFVSSAFADPRRKPGLLVSLSDPDQTKVEANFRLSGVTLSQNGADMEQALAGREELPIMVWGESVWGDSIWGDG